MKVYLFNADTGLYLGEDFIDDTAMKAGRVKLPPDATTIAPPRCERGQVPVFNVREQRWEIHEMSVLR